MKSENGGIDMNVALKNPQPSGVQTFLITDV